MQAAPLAGTTEDRARDHRPVASTWGQILWEVP